MTTEYDYGVTAKDVVGGFVHLGQGVHDIYDEGMQRLDRYTHPSMP